MSDFFFHLNIIQRGRWSDFQAVTLKGRYTHLTHTSQMIFIVLRRFVKQT